MRRSHPLQSACLTLLLTLAWGAPALAESPACPEPASAVATEAAKSAFRQGQTAFNEGDYARAVELWQLAYAKDCTAHAILLNLATAQELAGNIADAIDSLERFNERVPASSYLEPNRRRIERLQRSLSASTLPAAPAPVPVELPPPLIAPPLPAPAGPAPAESVPKEPRPTSSVANEAVAPSAPMVAPVATPAPPAQATQSLERDPAAAPQTQAGAGSGRSMLPLGVAAVGAAAGIVGSLVYVNGMVAAGSASERCGGLRSTCVDPQAVADGQAARARAETAGWVTGIGVVTAVGGVVWYFAQPAEPAQAREQQALRWTWDASIGREQGILSATRRF